MKWAWSDKGEISANKIIVATHFPFLNKNGSYFLKLYQHRSYVLALEGAQNVDGMYMDEMEKGISFRNYKSYLLLGGGSHRTGEKGGSIMKPQLLMNGIKATINLLTSTSKRCPHLGCTLKWNPAEHTWDCPCHGSRFHEDGKIIDNPSTGDEKKQFYGCKLPKYYL